MNLPNLTWQQVALIAVLVAAPIGAHFAGGPIAAGVTSSAAMLLAWFTKSPMPEPKQEDPK